MNSCAIINALGILDPHDNPDLISSAKTSEESWKDSVQAVGDKSNSMICGDPGRRARNGWGEIIELDFYQLNFGITNCSKSIRGPVE